MAECDSQQIAATPTQDSDRKIVHLWRPGQSGNPAGGKRKTLTRRDLDLVTELASRGCKQATMAAAVRMSQPTFSKYRDTHPELAEAIEYGRAMLHDQLVDVLLNKAKDGDTIAVLFSLKSMFGFRDQGPEAGEPRTSVTIVLPGAAPVGQYRPTQIIEADASDASDADTRSPSAQVVRG